MHYKRTLQNGQRPQPSMVCYDQLPNNFQNIIPISKFDQILNFQKYLQMLPKIPN